MPKDWAVISEGENHLIRPRSISLFDPNGVYIEVNYRYPGSSWPSGVG